MSETPISWGAVMTVFEPPELVLANVGWHLGHGAREVWVFLDRADDPVAPALQALPGCVVTLCDDAYWRDKHRRARPETQTQRQSLNATRAYRRTACDWLMHLDADEFLWQDRPITEEMAAFPEADAFLHLPNIERAFPAGQRQDGLFDGVFRVPFRGDPRLHEPLFGPMAPCLTKGLSGHVAGKTMVQTGRDFVMGVHRPSKGKRRKANRLPGIPSAGSVVLHFDGLTPLHWAIKVLRYAESEEALRAAIIGGPRLVQANYVRSHCPKLDDVLAFHAQVQGIAPDDHARLEAFGLLRSVPFDPVPVIAKGLNGDAPDLSPARFDAALRRQHAELLARYS